jgi:hypothetical protein
LLAPENFFQLQNQVNTSNLNILNCGMQKNQQDQNNSEHPFLKVLGKNKGK